MHRLCALLAVLPLAAASPPARFAAHTVATGLRGGYQVVAADLNHDGKPDLIALASGFDNQAKRSSGNVSVVRRGADPRQPWSLSEIDRLPASYRLRLAKIDGGAPVVVNAALTGSEAEPPDFRGGERSVYLYGYDGKRWKRQALDAGGMGAAACTVVDLNGDGRLDVACIGSATANLKWYENLGK